MRWRWYLELAVSSYEADIEFNPRAPQRALLKATKVFQKALVPFPIAFLHPIVAKSDVKADQLRPKPGFSVSVRRAHML